MKNNGSAMPIVILVVVIGFFFINYLVDEGSRFATIANAQRAAETAAKAAVASYSRVMAEEVRSCVKEKMEEISDCTYSDVTKQCLNKNIVGCDDETKDCISKSRDKCAPEYSNMIEKAKDAARNAAKEGTASYGADLNSFSMDDKGKAKVEIILRKQNLDGTTYKIFRDAEAIPVDVSLN